MVNPVSIALSGLVASTKRVAVAANNIVNANTVGSPDGTGKAAYTPQDVVSTPLTLENGQGAGTSVNVVERNPATVPAYMPNAPEANAQGLVARPNVEYATEIVNANQAANAYKANLAVIKVASDMQRDLLDTFDERA